MLIPCQPIINQSVPFEEKVQDHNAILDAFLNTHVLRNHSPRTQHFDESYLRGWFAGYKVQDDQLPDGGRLFVWEAMHPTMGAEIIKSYSTGLAETDLKGRTCAS